MDNVDVNIDNYSIDELLEILELSPITLSLSTINDKVQETLNKVKKDNKKELEKFINSARDKLENFLSGDYEGNDDEEKDDDEDDDDNEYDDEDDDDNDDDDEDDDDNDDDDEDDDDNDDDNYDEDEKENENEKKNENEDEYEYNEKKYKNWTNNEYLKQNIQNQNDKITDRENKTKIFNQDAHFVMKRERLGVPTTYNLPVSQGTINPSLINTTTRKIVVDSSYRSNILPCAGNDMNFPSANTNYSFDLSYPLINVLSMRLASIEIPTTWYTFDATLGNTMFKIGGLSESCRRIDDGNYSLSELIVELNIKVSDTSLVFALNNKTNKIEITNTLLNEDVEFIYYSPYGLDVECGANCNKNSSINQNLGWNLGLREEPDASGNISIIIPGGTTVTGCSPVNVYGPTYFILKLEDYNQNRINKGISSVIETETKINLPNYYTPDLSCVLVDVNGTTIETVQKTKSSPRTLTQAQIYSINEIKNNRQQSRTRVQGPSTDNSLGILPLKNITSLRPEPLIEYLDTLQTNERKYFGPVNINRMKVTLVDNKGNIVNLHDSDWSFSLIVEELYQY